MVLRHSTRALGLIPVEPLEPQVPPEALSKVSKGSQQAAALVQPSILRIYSVLSRVQHGEAAVVVNQLFKTRY